MKKITLILAASSVLALSANAQLIITGVVDGNETGGIPKGAELMATSNIADLSVFSLGRYTNGGSTISSVTALPAISLNAGDFFYVTGTATSDVFFTNAGFTVDLSNAGVVNINGDDLLSVVLSSDTTAIDTFGQPNQGDTDFYADSFAYRVAGQLSGNPGGNVDASPGFTITAWNETTWGNTFGTYVVPEPSTYAAIAGLMVLGLAVYRRRK